LVPAPFAQWKVRYTTSNTKFIQICLSKLSGSEGTSWQVGKLRKWTRRYTRKALVLFEWNTYSSHLFKTWIFLIKLYKHSSFNLVFSFPLLQFCNFAILHSLFVLSALLTTCCGVKVQTTFSSSMVSFNKKIRIKSKRVEKISSDESDSSKSEAAKVTQSKYIRWVANTFWK
jgi:hypothetical protein